MMNDCIEQEIIARPAHGMQLSEGYIRKEETKRFQGCLPGLVPCTGGTLEEVRIHLEVEAKAYYGDDVIVEIVARHVVVR